MAAREKVVVYDTNFNKLTELSSWIDLSWTSAIDTVGKHSLTLWNDASVRDLFSTDCFVEIQRSDLQFGLGWTREYLGFHRSPGRNITQDLSRTFVSQGADLKSLLQRREIRYYTGSAQADKDGPSDDVMKAYAIENLGVVAIAPPRLSNGVMANFLVDAATGQGIEYIGANAFRPLYDIIREIALFSLVDFDVVFTGSAGAPTFTFKTYWPFLGTDRTSTLTLSPELDSMAVPISYLKDRSSEANAMIALGQGSGAQRLFALNETLAINDSPWNLIEGNVSSTRQNDTVAGLFDAATAELQKRQAVETFSYTYKQAAQAVYGKDYMLGDKVNLAYEEIKATKRLLSVAGSVNSSNGGEKLTLVWGDLIL